MNGHGSTCHNQPRCPDEPDKSAMFIVRYTYYCCLTFVTWEWMINLPFEMSVIWRKSTGIWIQILYACPRYLGLVISIGNSAAISYIHAKYLVSLESCQLLYGFQTIAIAFLLLSLETLLMFRIFALFHCERRVGYILFAVLISKTVAISVLGLVTIRKFRVGDACLMVHVPFSSMLISAIELGFQTTLWCLALYKHIRTHLEHGWQDIPLLSLVTRDGSLAFGLLLVIYVALLKDAVSAFFRIPESTMRLCDISFPILVAAISLVTCRMIKNMRTFSPSHVDLSSVDIDPLRTSETGTIQLTEISSIHNSRF